MDWIEVERDYPIAKDYLLVKCVAEIKNNATGEIREHDTNELLEIGAEYPSVFNWDDIH